LRRISPLAIAAGKGRLSGGNQRTAAGVRVALSPLNLLLMFVGVILGIIIGVLPGLGGANGVAILLPLTFSMAQQPGGTTSAIILLSCIYWGALFGGAITSILFNIPGRTLVGRHHLRRPPARAARARGECADRGVYLLVHRGADRGDHDHVSIAVVAGFALRFGPPEFFSVYLLTFCAFVA